MLENTGLFSVMTDVTVFEAVELGIPAMGDLADDPGLDREETAAEGMVPTNW